MNRRSFLHQILAAGTFSILPGAGRLWVAKREVVRIPHLVVRYRDEDWLYEMTRSFSFSDVSAYKTTFNDVEIPHGYVTGKIEPGHPLWRISQQ